MPLPPALVNNGLHNRGLFQASKVLATEYLLRPLLVVSANRWRAAKISELIRDTLLIARLSMLAILSPAKTLDFETDLSVRNTTKPVMLCEAERLVGLLKQQSTSDLREMMGISEKLSELNHERFAKWQPSHRKEQSRAAIFAFRGDVYRGLDVGQLTAKQLEYSNNHLRILSGLYGILRPLDRIMAYRLEMGTSIANPRGKNLYQFWGPKIADQLNLQLETTCSKMLLNLASNEYFKSVDQSSLRFPVIAPAFKEFKSGKYKTISLFAKVARGAMASWVVRNRVKTVQKLLKYCEDGYRYDEQQSTERVPVFVRGD